MIFVGEAQHLTNYYFSIENIIENVGQIKEIGSSVEGLCTAWLGVLSRDDKNGSNDYYRYDYVINRKLATFFLDLLYDE